MLPIKGVLASKHSKNEPTPGSLSWCGLGEHDLATNEMENTERWQLGLPGSKFS